MGYFLTHEGSIKQRAYVNIPEWHAKGYTGKGITIFHDDVETSHSEVCVDMMQTILPDAKMLSGRISSISSQGKITECKVSCNETKEQYVPFEEFITKHNVTQINNSTGGKDKGDYVDSPMAKYMREMIVKHNLFCTGSAGNFDGMTNNFQGAFVMVSGLHLMPNGSLADYGSAGETVDFSMFMGFQSGTSFSAPFLNGMAGLLRSKWPKMTQVEIYEYFKSHCKDLGVGGKDPQYGWGLPIMGSAVTEIEIKVGSNIMLVDGKEITLDQPAIMDQKTWRVLVPTRAISEAFGAEVKWDQATQTVKIIK